jgi:hypothetical protein
VIVGVGQAHGFDVLFSCGKASRNQSLRIRQAFCPAPWIIPNNSSKLKQEDRALTLNDGETHKIRNFSRATSIPYKHNDRSAEKALSEISQMKKPKRKISRLTKNATDKEIIRWTRSNHVFDRLEAGVSEIIEEPRRFGRGSS